MKNLIAFIRRFLQAECEAAIPILSRVKRGSYNLETKKT